MNTNKTMLRPELYTYIKNNNLGERVKKVFGKNYTMCKTSDLQSIVDEHKKDSTKLEKIKTCTNKAHNEVKPTKVEVEAKAPVTVLDNNNIKKAFEILLEDLYENDYIDLSVKDEILDILNEGNKSTSNTTSPVVDDMSSPYSDAEISKMMREM